MPTIKVLSWNIYKFGKHLTSSTTRLNVVLDLVNPSTGPAFDLFVVIEPQIGSGKIGELATGSGADAMQKLRASLRARKNGSGWEVVPPVVLASSNKREALAVFFNSATLTLKGPVDDAKIKSKKWRTTKTQGSGAGSLRGKCEFTDSSNTKLTFPTGPERRPYLVTFETVSGSKTFSILAAHSPSPKYSGSTSTARNKQARLGTRKLGEIEELTSTHRAHPVIVVGDFNCCWPGHPTDSSYNCSTKSTDKDEEAEGGLTGEGFTSQISGGGSAEPRGTSLKGAGGKGTTATSYTNHAFDYLLTADGGGSSLTIANARILGLGDLTTGYSTTLNKTKFKPVFKRIRVTKGNGVSDHLPIAADITI
ncbi:MAG: hypothetical protein KDD47_17600 [Acidobacteria bacterium]|nr:hypothetical protein [Acidobacteriota bacterium]